MVVAFTVLYVGAAFGAYYATKKEGAYSEYLGLGFILLAVGWVVSLVHVCAVRQTRRI
jgi:hypothetical protein